MESKLSMNALFCFVFPPERLLIAPLYFGGAIMGQGRKMPKACSDRSPRTADAGIYDGMGDCREARRDMRKRSL